MNEKIINKAAYELRDDYVIFSGRVPNSSEHLLFYSIINASWSHISGGTPTKCNRNKRNIDETDTIYAALRTKMHLYGLEEYKNNKPKPISKKNIVFRISPKLSTSAKISALTEISNIMKMGYHEKNLSPDQFFKDYYAYTRSIWKSPVGNHLCGSGHDLNSKEVIFEITCYADIDKLMDIKFIDDVKFPTLYEYKGEYDPISGIVSYGCAKFTRTQINHYIKTLENIDEYNDSEKSNRKVVGILLDSQRVLSLDTLKEIQKAITNSTGA